MSEVNTLKGLPKAAAFVLGNRCAVSLTKGKSLLMPKQKADHITTLPGNAVNALRNRGDQAIHTHRRNES